MCSTARARSPSAQSLPKGLTLPTRRPRKGADASRRCRARSRAIPTSGEPILAGIGRYGPYVQHGKTYANLGRDDDVLEIGGNRAIDLIVAKEKRRRRGVSAAAPRGRRAWRASGGRRR